MHDDTRLKNTLDLLLTSDPFAIADVAVAPHAVRVTTARLHGVHGSLSHNLDQRQLVMILGAQIITECVLILRV